MMFSCFPFENMEMTFGPLLKSISVPVTPKRNAAPSSTRSKVTSYSKVKEPSMLSIGI